MPGAARPGGLLARFRGQGVRTGGQSVPPGGIHLPPGSYPSATGPAWFPGASIQGGVILWLRGQSRPLYGFLFAVFVLA